MRLSYRGVGYDYEPVPLDVVESGLVGQYRGQSMQFTYPRHIPVSQPVRNLKYRGVAYQTTESGVIESNPLSATTIGRGGQTISAGRNISRRAIMDEVARIHQQNIERLLQRRLESARARGDQSLISHLEREMQLISH